MQALAELNIKGILSPSDWHRYGLRRRRRTVRSVRESSTTCEIARTPKVCNCEFETDRIMGNVRDVNKTPSTVSLAPLSIILSRSMRTGILPEVQHWDPKVKDMLRVTMQLGES